MSDAVRRAHAEVVASMPLGFCYDESCVPAYTLPDPLAADGSRSADGTSVNSARAWMERRRPELLRLFTEQVYGRAPEPPRDMDMVVTSAEPNALGGLATRKEITLRLRAPRGVGEIHMLVYIPNRREGPAPCFVGLTYLGNQEVHADPGISLYQGWVPSFEGTRFGDLGVRDHRAGEGTRGALARGWCLERLLARGYGLAVAPIGDLDPDYHDGYQNGLHPLYYAPGQSVPAPDEWGCLGAWAWGMSRMVDYLVTDPAIHRHGIIAEGTSRLGKTALWAGAQDERFSLVITNESGCGGAALSRRRFGETVERINRTFPHWFCDHFTAYSDREADLPVDQHALIALMAPRPVYVASAEEDLWSDPRGEFLGAFHASPVYRLLGTDGLSAEAMPDVEQPITSTIGYHLRIGGHGINAYDWDRFMDWADQHLRG